MNKNMRYPVEAFALAMVLFSSGMKSAMIVGIALIFGDLLQGVIKDMAGGRINYAISGAAALITAAAMYGMHVFVGMTPEWKDIAGFILISALLMKHHTVCEQADTEMDANAVLTADSVVYGVYVLMAIIREYLSSAKIFELQLEKTAIVSGSFGKAMFALFFAAVAITIVNAILKTQSAENAGLWVCIPVILLEVPFVWGMLPELAGAIVGILVTGIIYLTLRQRLLSINKGSHVDGVVVETATLGMIYMMITIL